MGELKQGEQQCMAGCPPCMPMRRAACAPPHTRCGMPADSRLVASYARGQVSSLPPAFCHPSTPQTQAQHAQPPLIPPPPAPFPIAGTDGNKGQGVQGLVRAEPGPSQGRVRSSRGRGTLKGLACLDPGPCSTSNA